MSHIRQHELAEVIRKSGLKRQEFILEPYSDYRFRCAYKPISDYAFIINESSQAIFSPGVEGQISSTANSSNWVEATRAFKKWVDELIANIAVSNAWGDMQEDNIGGSFRSESLGIFTESETIEISNKLDQILEWIANLGVDIERIKEDIDYLKNSSETASRKDWSLMMMGSVMGWGLDKAVPSDKLSELWNNIRQTFSSGLKLLG